MDVGLHLYPPLANPVTASHSSLSDLELFSPRSGMLKCVRVWLHFNDMNVLSCNLVIEIAVKIPDMERKLN